MKCICNLIYFVKDIRAKPYEIILGLFGHTNSQVTNISKPNNLHLIDKI